MMKTCRSGRHQYELRRAPSGKTYGCPDCNRERHTKRERERRQEDPAYREHRNALSRATRARKADEYRKKSRARAEQRRRAAGMLPREEYYAQVEKARRGSGKPHRVKVEQAPVRMIGGQRMLVSDMEYVFTASERRRQAALRAARATLSGELADLAFEQEKDERPTQFHGPHASLDAMTYQFDGGDLDYWPEAQKALSVPDFSDALIEAMDAEAA